MAGLNGGGGRRPAARSTGERGRWLKRGRKL